MSQVKIVDKTPLAIDFDGVIHKYSEGWKDGTIYDKPVPGAKTSLAKLIKQSYKITIFTTRLNPTLEGQDPKEQEKLIRTWLEKWGFIQNKHFHEITGLKPLAKLYIDDKAIRFFNWKNVLEEIK